MFRVTAKRQLFKPLYRRVIDDHYEAFDAFQECIEKNCKEVYITCVSKNHTSAHRDITRKIKLAQEIKKMSVPQQVVGVRIGEKLLDIVGQFSDKMNKSQNGYIMSAIDYGLSRDLGADELRLDDWGSASHNRQQFSIRISCQKLKKIDQKAEKLKVTRSTWIVWAILFEWVPSTNRIVDTIW